MILRGGVGSNGRVPDVSRDVRRCGKYVMSLRGWVDLVVEYVLESTGGVWEGRVLGVLFDVGTLESLEEGC